MNRRQFLASTASLAALPVITPTPAIAASRSAKIAQYVEAYRREFSVVGVAMAISRKSELIFAQGFGHADREAQIPMQPHHRMRIASVSKPFTSAAIFSLIQAGRLGQHDRVFGANGLLPQYRSFEDPRVERITVDHLLTHTCGGWSNRSKDPMFRNKALSTQELIRHTLKTRALDADPGAQYAYSNFGFCVLGRVIEAITSAPYDHYVKERFFGPIGAYSLEISGNTETERLPGEAKYYTGAGEFSPYAMNVRRMDAHGGWVASPTDLIRFLNHVDGFPTPPDLLSAQSIQAMTTPNPVSRNYARGWRVNKHNNWWHSGSLPGTTSFMARIANGDCFAAITNSRLTEQKREMASKLDRLMWKVARAL
ncbi:serine hydrolase domain-containing protein [Magnetofaba australis]|nr:serine hydrolase domain-containing protein [Magnetofaba australis]